jgi:hypothetical protein
MLNLCNLCTLNTSFCMNLKSVWSHVELWFEDYIFMTLIKLFLNDFEILKSTLKYLTLYM